MGIFDRMMEEVTGPDDGRVVVRRYRNEGEYARDAAEMVRRGYVGDVHYKDGKVNVGRTAAKAVVFLPWALLRPSHQGDAVTVTWTRS